MATIARQHTQSYLSYDRRVPRQGTPRWTIALVCVMVPTTVALAIVSLIS